MLRISAVISCFALAFMTMGTATAGGDTPMSIKGGTYVDVTKAKSLYDKGVPFVDTRVVAEYADKHVKGAINVVFKEGHPKEETMDATDKFDMSKLPADKNKEILFYCNGKGCWKGYKAALTAINGGYKAVYWFRDGMPAWDAKAYPSE